MNQKPIQNEDFLLLTNSDYLLVSCEKDENLIIDSEIFQETEFLSVNADEAYVFIKSSKLITDISETNKASDLLSGTPIWDLRYNGLDSSENYLIVPFFLDIENNTGVFSRVILRRNNNGMEAILYTKIFDSYQDNNQFDGKVFFHSLEGKYLEGYRLRDNIIVSKFLGKGVDSASKSGDGDCNSPGCSLGEGEEVVVYGDAPSTINTSSYYSNWVNQGMVTLESDVTPNTGGGGGNVPCIANFDFKSVTSHNLWQETKIVSFSQDLSFSGSVIEGTPGQSLIVNISQLTFGMPYFNVEGSLVYSYWEADVIGAEAIALAIRLLESEFKRSATKGLSYNSYYYGKRFRLILAAAFKAATKGRGTVGATGSGTGGGLKVYVPCA